MLEDQPHALRQHVAALWWQLYDVLTSFPRHR